MASEILELLLLLLSPGNSDNPGRWDKLQPQEMRQSIPGSKGGEVRTEKEQRLEGETFSVNCSYNPQEHENEWMNWCKKLSNGVSCLMPRLERSSNFSLLGKNYFSYYDSKRNIFTITMYELKINDSGVYECRILKQSKQEQVIFRRFSLVVSLVLSQSTVKPTSEVISDNQVPNRSNTLSTVPPCESSSNNIIIFGVVFSCLLLLVLLVVGWICTKRIYEKARKGDDSEKQGDKSKMESNMNAVNIHYATMSNKNARELINDKIHIPTEVTEYATIK